MKNFKKRPWFKAKKYGWGWYPATWEGWSIMLVWITVVSFIVYKTTYLLEKNPSFLFPYIFEIGFFAAPLILVCYITGEKPRWQWGEKKKKKSRR